MHPSNIRKQSAECTLSKATGVLPNFPDAATDEMDNCAAFLGIKIPKENER
jgi:hypothetical protein